MNCAWESLLMVLPPWLRQKVDEAGKQTLQELRLRINAPPELNLGMKRIWLKETVSREDLLFCMNTASRYSPWTAATISQGYLTIRGGHRIGICGEAVCKDGHMAGIREVRSLNIRVARDFPGIANGLHPTDSVLILGAPGWGKTTLLRDLARITAQNQTVAVVDERGELYPDGIPHGRQMDVLTGCPKGEGIGMVLKVMGPDWIAVDEITASEDASALIRATGCGVRLMATAHATSAADLRKRPVYRPLLDLGIFRSLILLHPDKSFKEERILQ